MDQEQAKQLAEIHATVIRGMPSDVRLRAAAQEVVAAFYGLDNDERVKNAIEDLASALEENQG